MKIIKLLFGQYWHHRHRLWMKKVRLRRHIKIAREMYKLNQGRRLFVLEVDFIPGHYIIKTWKEIKALRRQGVFSTRAKREDFFKEAAYIVPDYDKSKETHLK
jgi:hypothetical protein